jgi:tetratricopeptide (TPR) repeat protein
VVAVICAVGADARADKKKPGLFDIDGWKLPVTRERDFVNGNLAPHGMNLDPAVAPQGESRAIRLRIYADRDYRGTVLRWQGKVKAQIQRINAVLGPVFNVHFEIESLREWDRSHAGVQLGDPLIEELMALDPAREVDLVIGLVTPLRGVATSAHHVGIARLLSRHFVMRGMDDEQEFQDFEREFKLISAEERQRLYANRKAHKEVVVFLHEWGHTLGLLHEDDRNSIMNPLYRPEESGFSDYDKRIVALVLERRLGARDLEFPESADLLPLVEAMPTDEGSDADRAALVELVRSRARHTGARKAAREAPDAVELDSKDVDAYNKAIGALNAGRADEAWKVLAPVLERTAARKVGGKTWVRLAELAAATGALTRADEAAERAGAAAGAQKVVADIESVRHRIALPLDAAKLGVPPDREPAYVAGFWDTAKKLDAGGDLAPARAKLDELAAAFPEAPGVEVLRCDLELKSKHVPAASKHCEAALEKFKGATRAHYLLALIALRARREAVGEQHLRQAILLDPADPSAWRALAQLYRSTGASRRLAELASQHQALLSSPLPE